MTTGSRQVQIPGLRGDTRPIPAAPRGPGHGWTWFLSACLVLGAILRLAYPADIMYKTDERYMVDALQQYRRDHVLPPIGMPSSAAIPNPGLSVWIFLFLGQLTRAAGPVELTRAVALFNLLALAALAIAARRAVPEADREVWSWTVALFCVNAFPVLFARQIWAQSVAPVFSIALVLAWFRRDRRLAAFAWGLLSLLLGQVHMAGFFSAAGLLLWTAIFGRWQQPPKRVPWLYVVAGIALGSLPMMPWIPYLTSGTTSGSYTNGVPSLDFWSAWVRTSLGLGLGYSLGSVQVSDFLRGPIIGSHATYVVAALQVITVAVVGVLAVALLRHRRQTSLLKLVGAESETVMVESSALWGTGLLMTVLTIPAHFHYLLVMYPLPWIWLSRLGNATGRWGRIGLALIWCAQLLVTLLLLSYIHTHHGAALGRFGVSYGAQPH